MPTALTTENATITTVAVTIHALKIGTKQVTQSVFKQLPEEPLIAQDGTLNGVPWGRVNWHPDKCAEFPAHWHIVWQRGGELLRSRVEQDPFAPGGAEADFRCAEADRLLTARVHAWLLTCKGPSPLDNPLIHTRVAGTYRRRYAQDNERPITVMGIPVLASASIAAVAAHRDQAGIYPSRPFERGTARAVLAAEVDGYGVSRDQLWADLETVVAIEAARRERHRDTRAALSELPQLFIAV